MDKLNKIFKNLVIFLAIFLTINYVFQSCSNKEQDYLTQEGNIIASTAKDEYSRVQTVIVEIKNYTDKEINLKNECPNEPFEVYKYENNEWAQRIATPELNCEDAKDYLLAPGKEIKIPYENWNYALFSEMGKFKIQFDTEIDDETKTISTNEFLVVKEGILKQLWQGIVYKPIYNGLIYLISVIPGHSLGLAIILLTLLIRTILLIPNHKAMMSQKKLQDIQPKLEKIKEKYKGDQKKISMETMAVWKEAKVNPMGSCLPLLLQFPFLIAVFYVVKGGLNPDNAYLLYTDYSGFSFNNIGVHFLGLDLTKPNIYILPLIIGGLQFLQIKLSTFKKKKDTEKPKNEMMAAQNMMLYVMPVMIAVFTASLPAGVGIYWGVSTLFGVLQQLFINKKGEKDEVKVKVIEDKQ